MMTFCWESKVQTVTQTGSGESHIKVLIMVPVVWATVGEKGRGIPLVLSQHLTHCGLLAKFRKSPCGDTPQPYSLTQGYLLPHLMSESFGFPFPL
jgi:hypothetical protein